MVESEKCNVGRQEPKLLSILKRVIAFLLLQWFIIGVGIVILLAYFFPNVGRSGGIIRAEYTVKYLVVAIIFFISGLTLSPQSMGRRLLDWRLHLLTQGGNFLLFSAIVYAVVNIVKAADPDFEHLNRWAVLGMLVTACLPTTVASNVVMTGQAGGDQSAATIEVMIGNLAGAFLTPALLQLYTSNPSWSFGALRPAAGRSVSDIYVRVIEQLGLSVFIPLFIGEVIQWIWPVWIAKWRVKLRLSKIGQLCLLIIIWSTFSTPFYSHSFEAIANGTIVFVILVNILMYIMMAIVFFLLARCIPCPTWLASGVSVQRPKANVFVDVETAVAVLFCGPAKGIVLGTPLIQICYNGLSLQEQGIILVPAVLYQGFQIVFGQISVQIIRNWRLRTLDAGKAVQVLEEDAAPGETPASKQATADTSKV